MTREEKLNAISRFIILLSLLGYIFLQDFKILMSGIISLFILVLTYYILNKENIKKKENFSNDVIYNNLKSKYTIPNNINPIMNILLPEIQDNPQRLESAPSYNKEVENDINKSTQDFIKKNFDDENIDEKLFKDLGDKFDFEQSMRQFYTTAITTIPNNQTDFAKFCYGNMASCRDGDVEMCYKDAIRHINM